MQSKAIARGPLESPGRTWTILNPAGVIISTSDTTGTLSTVPPNGWNVTFQSTQQYYGTEYTSITVSAPSNAPLASGYEVIVGTPGYYVRNAGGQGDATLTARYTMTLILYERLLITPAATKGGAQI